MDLNETEYFDIDINETECLNFNGTTNETECLIFNGFSNDTKTPDDEFVNVVRDVLEGVLIPLVGSCGLIGKMLSKVFSDYLSVFFSR